jgi:hypothetical protein
MTYLLLVLVLLLSIVCLYLILRRNPMSSYPPDPPVPPKPGEPTRPRPQPAPVSIRVVRNQQGEPIDLQIEPQSLPLAENQQAKWSTQDGRLEIRFSAKLTPFAGDTYEVARGGESFSGAPLPKRPSRPSFEYTALVTTSDGYFLSKKAEVRITTASPKHS